jgi:hypothetical protein
MSAPKATPTPTPKAPTSGAVPAAVAKTITPIITKAPTTATSFVGPIPTGTTRTATGYVPAPVAAPKPDTSKADAAAATAAAQSAAAAAQAAAEAQAARDAQAAANAAEAARLAQQGIDAANAAAAASDRTTAAIAAQTAAANAQAELDRSDAFKSLQATFDSYGLGSLAGTIQRLMTQGETANGALTRLKYDTSIDPATNKSWNDGYVTRFSGNQIRIKNGLNAISEAQYIANENAYAETFKAYGLGNMLSTDRAVNEAKFATYIGNDMSSTELNDRIKTAANNVINADPVVMSTFKQYYGGLTTSDLVAYFLAPDETLPVLNNKIAAAQIGTAAQEQGLVDAYGNTNVSSTRAMQLATQMGGLGSLGNVAGAYQSVASVLPAGQKLSDIYKQAGINYDQTTAENEFLTQNADAAQKRKQLASLERAQFGGDYGVNPTAGNLASARSVVGKF